MPASAERMCLDIRSGFATRGAGAGARPPLQQPLFTIVESFYPSSAAGTITFSDSLGNNNGMAEPGEDLVFTIPLTNRLTTTDTNVNGARQLQRELREHFGERDGFENVCLSRAGEHGLRNDGADSVYGDERQRHG